MTTLTVQLKYKKTTPGTVVYHEISNDLGLDKSVPSVYIRKDAMAQLIGTGTIPTEITVTVTV